jgi:dipeptidyl aminopeptidase/acylaminoacyl peptidase
MRQQIYPGSEIIIEEVLEPGTNYAQYRVSYLSEGLKQYALMTVPFEQRPESGFPVIIFNHGYIPPNEYRTTERYVAYVQAIARRGYIVFRPDYRGHDRSEGEPRSAYRYPDYTIDVLNAVASIKRYPDADPNRIGMWGHSMGGYITLRIMVTTHDVRAGVIWAGVVAPYADLMTRWRPTRTPAPGTSTPGLSPWWLRSASFSDYGSPEETPDFWNSISPAYYLQDLSGPIQLHHGTEDRDVPVYFSTELYEQALKVGVPAELYTYSGDNHNISINFSEAMTRSLYFFDRYVKEASS